MASLTRFSFATPGPFTPLSPSATGFTGLARPRPVLSTVGGILHRVLSSISAMSTLHFSFAAPTAPPLGPFTPLSPSGAGFTGLDSARPRPVLFTAVGGVLRRAFSSITATSTLHLKWLSLGNFSRRHPNICPTPTSGYYREPTTTLITTGNFSLAVTVVPLLLFFFSVLFGVGVVLGRRRECSRPLHAKNENPPHDSLYSESPTLFHQDDTVLPLGSNTPRHSYFWSGALSFGLRGLLICTEKLLDMVEVNTAEQRTATSRDSAIAELRDLKRKLGQATNIAPPTETVVSPARLADANETLVAPFSVHARPKPGQGLLPPSEYDEVELILLPKNVKARIPTCVKIDPASTRKAAVTPPVQDVFGVITDVVLAGATSVALPEGDGGRFPTSYHRSSWSIRRPTSSPDTVDAPFPVEPPGVPVIPSAASSPVYEASYTPFRPIRLTTDRPSTPPHKDTVSPSAEPVRGAAPEPHAESSPQADVRRTRRLEHSLPRPPSVPALDVRSKPHPPSIYQTAVQRIFQPCFDDLANYSKPTAPISSIRPMDTTLKFDPGRSPCSSASTNQREWPKTPPRKNVTAFHCSPEDFRVQSTRHRLASTPRPINGVSPKDPSEMEALRLTREILLSDRSSAVAQGNRSSFKTVETMRDDARKVIERSREASRRFDLRMRAKYPEQFSTTSGTDRLDSPKEIQEKAQRVILRSQDLASALDLRIRTKYPPRPKSTNQGDVMEQS